MDTLNLKTILNNIVQVQNNTIDTLSSKFYNKAAIDQMMSPISGFSTNLGDLEQNLSGIQDLLDSLTGAVTTGQPGGTAGMEDDDVSELYEKANALSTNFQF